MKSSFPDIVIPETSFSEFMKEKIREFGEDIAMIDNIDGKRITFKELYDQINKLSFALARVGLEKGDVVGIYSANCIEYPVVYLAILSCGATVMTCSESLAREKLLHQFQNAEPRFLIVANKFEETAMEVTKELSYIEEVFTINKSFYSRSTEQLIENEVTQENFTQVEVDLKVDSIAFFYSSGTTGPPKGIVHTNSSLVTNLEIWRSQMKLFRSNCCFIYVPLYSCYSLLSLFLALADGAKCVIDRDDEYEKLLDTFEKHKVSHIFCGIKVITEMAKRTPKRNYDTSSLLQINCSGTTISPYLMSQVEKRFKCIVSSSYGLTEMDPLAFNHPVTYEMSSCGVIPANTMVKICDRATGKDVGIGKLGNILAKGIQMMKGYLKNPEKTAEAIDKDGWFHTGDIGYLDKNGMLYIIGRQKDLFECKGNLVSPAELEDVLLQHPLILEAGVIAVPDEDVGGLPRAYVVAKNPTLDEEKVKKFVEDKLPSWKHLHGGVEFMDQILISSEGKIARRKLLEMYQQKLKICN